MLKINTDPAAILQNRKDGLVYTADFSEGTGRYISSSFSSSDVIDASIKISPRIEIRLTYILNDEEIKGIQILKLNSNREVEKIHLSTLDWQGVLGLLSIFSEIDLKSLGRKSILLNENIVDDLDALEKFLKTISLDNRGRDKMAEVVRGLHLLNPGDIDGFVEKKAALKLMEEILSNDEKFANYKKELDVGKDEEVWQKFFEGNPWILGSDFVQILEERDLDEDSTMDIPVRDFDGFLDIIELKLPVDVFWTNDVNPNAKLTKAIMQCMRYITEAERRMNDTKKLDSLKARILKPKITLIFGRSCDWDEPRKNQFRILNSSFHNITILTYDHVLNRAKQSIDCIADPTTKSI